MTTTTRIELISGMATGLAELITIVVMGANEFSFIEYQWVAGALLFFGLPGLLVAAGSYLHAVRRKFIGFIMLVVGGLFLMVMMFVYTFGGIFYLYGLWGGAAFLIPSATAITAVVAAVNLFRKNKVT